MTTDVFVTRTISQKLSLKCLLNKNKTNFKYVNVLFCSSEENRREEALNDFKHYNNNILSTGFEDTEIQCWVSFGHLSLLPYTFHSVMLYFGHDNNK